MSTFGWYIEIKDVIKLKGTVFSIEEFSVYDGPGIRTTVFLKGCPLRCGWCHNPEGQENTCEIVRSPNGCIMCGKCEKYAQVLGGRIKYTKASIDNCPVNLLRVCGEEYESDALCKKLIKNERILKNGGGITFSGGEPFAQSSFLFECLSHLKGKLHTAIQTSGYCTQNIFEQALVLSDYFLFDLKLFDEQAHIKYTGVSNSDILKNFSLLAESSKSFTVRIPLIPTITDTEENILGIAKLLHSHKVQYAELLPYNKMAGGKYAMLGRKYTPDFDETIEVSGKTDIFDSFGIKTKIL